MSDNHHHGEWRPHVLASVYLGAPELLDLLLELARLLTLCRNLLCSVAWAVVSLELLLLLFPSVKVSAMPTQCKPQMRV